MSKKKVHLTCFCLFLLAYALNGCTPTAVRTPRQGFGVSTKADVELWGNRLGAEWYLDWTVATDRTSGLERWQMVRVSPDGYRPGAEELARLVRQNRGHVWVIGNEPDNITQDGVDAVRYAEIYHEVAGLIKENDPTALIAVGGVTQPSALRMEYLELVLDSYQEFYGEPLPVDWWTVHAYVLNEGEGEWGAGIPVGMLGTTGVHRVVEDHGNLALFGEQIKAFRVWMKDRGYQNHPLAVTEFGILLSERDGYSQEFIAQYLLQSCEWLDSANDLDLGYAADEYRLVQRWAWFSLSDPLFPSSNLAELDLGRLTKIGQAYQGYSAGLESSD